MDKWSNKYWWWIEAHKNKNLAASGYFYAPYIPIMKEGIIKMGSENV